MSFSVATYNVLASAYANRAWYPRTPAMVLNSAWRVPALVQHISALKADILCLQEVEPDVFATLRTALAENSYNVQYARKAGDRPDGVAIFYRREKLELVSAGRLIFADGEGAAPNSGYIALIATFRVSGGRVGVINTHLLWDPPGTDLETQLGYRQARELLVEHEKLADSADAWIFAGDFNATPESAIVSMVESAGFCYAHQNRDGVCTCNFNAQAKMIDYLFHSAALRSEAEAITAIDDLTILPSAEQPSDHVPIVARFDWKT